MSSLPQIALSVALTWHPTALSASAYRDGNELYRFCRTDAAAAARTVCNNYIMGAVDTLMMGGLLCPPSNAPVGELVDMVIKYLRDNPDMRHYTAASDRAVALQEFNCKNSN